MSNQQAISIFKSVYILRGKVINNKKHGVAGLKVEAFDYDFNRSNDYLGADTTDEGGAFEICFNKSDFTEHKPDIFFKVYQNNNLLLNTQEHFIRDADENTKPIILTVDATEKPSDYTEQQSTNGDAKIIWIKVKDVAQYKGANWNNEVQRASNLTVDQAKSIALMNPDITYFFHVTSPMVLEGRGSFKPNDVVFFSGKPWYGSAVQADAYEKREVSWIEKPGVAQYGGADWNNEILRMRNLSVEQAKIYAEEHPDIDFFFRTHANMWLQGKKGPGGFSEKGHFHDGDVVFFSGKPWYGSAPQSVAYEKQVKVLW